MLEGKASLSFMDRESITPLCDISLLPPLSREPLILIDFCSIKGLELMPSLMLRAEVYFE